MAHQTSVALPIAYVMRRTTSMPDHLLQSHAARRLHFALRRFEDKVRSVTVRLTDENGPRKGVDTRCVLSVQLHHGAPLVVESTSAWPTAAITAAAKRLNEVVRRHTARALGRRRRG